MPRKAKAPLLSKLSRPRLFGAEPRERLFAQLDAARSQGSGACVVGPPGAGKTTLVASWLDARACKGIWYQVDPGDADLATFFHYLGQAAQPYARRGKRPLPALTPEYLSDIRGYGRRFFREVFARMPVGSVLVLDNYQEVDADNLFHEVIAEAVDEVPPGGLLVVVSRADPPACYARLRANRAVRTIVWDDLRLTREEARAVARLQHAVDDRVVDALHEQCDGWAAGLILMLEQAGGAPGSAVPAGSQRQAVFDYFAGTLFDRAPSALQHLLLQVALLPYVKPAWAQELSGDPQAERLLESLHRRHFFTQRRDEAEGSYQFHALFQAFLRAKARRSLVEDDYRDLLMRTAGLLAEAAEQEAAFELMCESGNWDRAADLLLAEAPRMMEAGRWRTLTQTILRLPAHYLEAQPWLQYWLGLARIPANPEEALRILEGAYAGYRQRDDHRGQCLCAAGVLDAIVSEWRHQGRAAPWIQVLSALMASSSVFLHRDEELRLLSAMLIPCAQVLPAHPELPAIMNRVLALLEDCADLNLTAWSLIGIVDCVWSNGPLHVADRAIRLIEPRLRSADLAPVVAARVWLATGRFAALACDFTTALARIDRALEIAQGHGELELQQEHLAASFRGYTEALLGDRARLEITLRHLDSIRVPDLPGFRANRALLQGLACSMAGDDIAAGRCGAEAIADCDLANVQFMRITFRLVASDWAARRDDVSAFRELHAGAASAADQMGAGSWFRHTLTTQRFYLALTENHRDEARHLASDALSEARRHGISVHLMWMPTVTARLCSFALEHGIEADHARALIAQYGLRPPALDAEYWPWAVKIRTLGRFDLVVDGHHPSFARKAPRRLLQLLKALIAFGGKDIPAQTLVDAIWPDEDADNAARSLQTGLARLRKLLGGSDLVTIQDGHISLNPDRFWVDAFVFMRMADSGSQPCEADVERVCSLYQGSFLSTESDAPWALPMRERLRSRFLRHVQTLGARFEEEAHWDRAASWYQRGIDADPLMEVAHQGLVRCYFRAGRRAEAISAYRRLRDTLSVILGIAPSAESEALYAELYAST